MSFSPGLRLTGRYTLVGQIGRGGMSEVWRADDDLLDRPVAVKALASPLAADPEMRAATWREARSAARLTHPHVTQVYDYGEAPLDGGAPMPYLVMELVDGQNLAERLNHGPLPWRSAVRVAAQVAGALAAAHRLGVVHHDVKPGNVMLTDTGAKVLDFGIAALTDAHPDSEAGWLIGTPAYAAPERLRPGGADPASDIYSLGALLYASLTGHPPIDVATWADASAAHERGERPAAPHAAGLPAEVAALCLSCLSREPTERPAAGEVAARLTAVIGEDAPATGHPAVLAPSSAAHPPTLVDRSLLSGAVGAPPSSLAASTTLASPGTSPAGQPSTGPRIMASAPVPRPSAALTDDSDASADQPRRSRMALVAIAGGIVAAGLVLTLVAAAFGPGSRPTPAANQPIPTATAVGAPATPSPAASPTAQLQPSTPAGIANEIDLLITESVNSGQMQPAVAADLRSNIDAMRQSVSNGRLRDVRNKAVNLQQKIDDHLQNGDITSATAAQLQAVLQPLLVGNGQTGNGWNGNGRRNNGGNNG
jgi:serine/threonine-protein kinase